MRIADDRPRALSACEWRKRVCQCIAWLCLSLLAALNFAQAAEPVPELTGLLVDQAGALSDDERAAVTARLRAIQDSGRAQVAILVSSGTGGEPLADYALRVAEKWQLGRASRDDGLLVLVVPSRFSWAAASPPRRPNWRGPGRCLPDCWLQGWRY